MHGDTTAQPLDEATRLRPTDLAPESRPAASGVSAGLYAGFTLTGFGCALPGVLLPLGGTGRVAGDARAGLLFFAIASGSALAPLLLGGRALAGLRAGQLLLLAAGTAWALAGHLGYASGALWGLALGAMMTATSLLSGYLPGLRSQALVRLNFLWAAGACACPVLTGALLRLTAARAVPVLVCLVAAVCALLTAPLRHVQVSPSRERRVGPDSTLQLNPAPRHDPALCAQTLPLPLVVAAALAPGVEACAGAWLPSFAARTLPLAASSRSLSAALAAPTCFWGGLLLSRALGSLPGVLPRVLSGGTRQLRVLLLAVLAACTCLMLPPSPLALLAEAAVLGLGLGPLYPQLLARALARRPSTLVFFLAGLASSVLPWMTGVVSARGGGLRVGLLVPVTAAAVLLALGWRAASLPAEIAGTE